MGLDMYLQGETFFYNEKKNDDGIKLTNETVQIGYWRKHPDLHGYIVEKFQSGIDDCRRTRLSLVDLITIYKAIKFETLPKTSGFFFGESIPEDRKESLEIIDNAMEWLKNEEEDTTRRVHYKSSW